MHYLLILNDKEAMHYLYLICSIQHENPSDQRGLSRSSCLLLWTKLEPNSGAYIS